jgi:hypothetical protein
MQNGQVAHNPSDYDDLGLRLIQANRLAALLQRVGYALWQIAECEDTVAHYVVLRLHATQGMGEQAGMALLASAQGRTFGNLLSELRNRGVLEGDLEARIGRLVEDRNWLVHRAKRENRGILNDSAAYDALLERLTALADEATDLHILMASRLEAYAIEAGVDSAQIDREAAALRKAWGYE